MFLLKDIYLLTTVPKRVPAEEEEEEDAKGGGLILLKRIVGMYRQ